MKDKALNPWPPVSVQAEQAQSLDPVFDAVSYEGKCQMANPKKQGNHNSQHAKSQTTAHALGSCLEFGSFSLELACHLDLGICDFRLFGLK